MRDDWFEWDDVKASSNFAKHGVSFEMARDVFEDIFALDWVDDAQNETRYVTLGLVEGRLLFVVYTMRDERICLISARLATPVERRQYHEANKA